MAKIFTLMRNLSVIGLIIMIISIAFSSFAEEITLTTIMPSQGTLETLRAKRGVVGDHTTATGDWDYRDVTLSDDNLLVGGNLGIGTATPTGVLDVVGYNKSISLNTGGGGHGLLVGADVTIKAAGSGSIGGKGGDIFITSGYAGGGGSTGGNIVLASGLGNPNGGHIIFITQEYVGAGGGPGFERMRINQAGNVGIGTTNPGTYRLYVNGTFYQSGSSQAYKENIEDLEVDVDKIYTLRPVSFDYKEEYKHYGKELGDGRQIGLIAEEVNEVIPELAIRKDGKITNVDFEKLGIVLLGAIKKLKTENDTLRQRIEVLETRLNIEQ